MERSRYNFGLVFVSLWAVIFKLAKGCSIDSVPMWGVPVPLSIRDVDRGVFFREASHDIQEGVFSTTVSEGFNAGPYINVIHENSEIIISTNDAYEYYEQNETAQQIGITVVLTCTNGVQVPLILSINIIDTNNNSPELLPSINYEFSIPVPIPPGYVITDCVNDLIVKDIDLTTQRIDFEINESDFFEISYDVTSSVPKEFKAVLKSVALIRSLPEPVTLTLSATDVDLTGDPRRTSYGTITILANNDFRIPDEPVFSQPFYLATYTNNHELLLEDTIYLQQGYDDEVKFHIDDPYSEFFEIDANENKIDIKLMTQLTEEILTSEQQIYLVIRAERKDTSGATAPVIIQLPEARLLNFLETSYSGTIENDTVSLIPIILDGYDTDVEFILTGDYSEYFNVINTTNIISIEIKDDLPESFYLDNNYIVLTLSASGVNTVTSVTSIFLIIIKDDGITPIFSQNIYYGIYINESTIDIEEVQLVQGQDDSVSFTLTGDHRQFFAINETDGRLKISLVSPITEETIYNEKVLFFGITAEKPFTVGAHAVIAISFPEELTVPTVLRFSQNTYKGSLINDILEIDSIILETGFTTNTKFELIGEYKDHFTTVIDNNVIMIQLISTNEIDEIFTKNVIILEIEASGDRSVSTSATIIIDNNSLKSVVIPIFNKPYYMGRLTVENGLEFAEIITLHYGFDELISFTLEGENVEWFAIIQNGNNVSLALNTSNLISDADMNSNRYFLFAIVATKPEAIAARAAIFIDLPGDVLLDTELQFAQNYYTGYLENGFVVLDPIVLEIADSSEISLNLNGDLYNHFQINEVEGEITLEVFVEIPDEELQIRNILVFALEASSSNSRSHTIIILEIIKNSTFTSILSFDKAFYIGSYSVANGFQFEYQIILMEGFDASVRFSLAGDYSTLFSTTSVDDSVTLTLNEPLPNNVIENYTFLAFVIVAENNRNMSTRSTVIIEIIAEGRQCSTDPTPIYPSTDNPTTSDPTTDQTTANPTRDSTTDLTTNPTITDPTPNSTVYFDKLLYRGYFESGVISHETITLYGYTGSTILIRGDYGELFHANSLNGIVTIVAVASVTFPDDIDFIALELQAAGAYAVLILDVISSGGAVVPTVAFSLPLYTFWTEISHTGSIGHVYATSDTGEPVTYSLIIDNDHLRQRLSVNNMGELTLSAPANSGAHTFQVVATTIVHRSNATTQVSLWVDAATICGTDIVLPPLIIIERLEEEPHHNLVVLNRTLHEGCSYQLTNHWPHDQNWLHVDGDGLHATSIDREDERIAFMSVSQIQIELMLHCDSDETRFKRSLTSTRQDYLDPYDYGSRNWILTDTILYNSRRSIVNLIVVDINDNSPIFIDKENEPLYVGYPVAELENIILPKSLIEVKATDADIGENAALRYWSSDEIIAVSPQTGLVHIRHSSQLENDRHFTINATDQNGAGHTGSIDIVVKLLVSNQVAVIVIQNAFLEDDQLILANLSEAVGYTVKSLRSVSIAEDTQELNRRKRDVIVLQNLGTSLQLIIYGLQNNEPVNVNQLTSDINNSNMAAFSISNIMSLEEHLQSLEMCILSGSNTALLVSTIVLASVILLSIVMTTVWFFLKWKRNRNYEQFNDTNSITSREEVVQEIPKAEIPAKTRLDIGELKKSERRLQEMLNKPDEEVKPVSTENEKPNTTLIDISPEPQMPIVIQSIDKLKDNEDESDDDDEFGEKSKVKRKSVVTFNENVEKIIHIEDIPESPAVDIEVYKF